ncbi:MAG: class I SAM-dependent methyltransferase [Candidatus Dormibacteraceae bacterium]
MPEPNPPAGPAAAEWRRIAEARQAQATAFADPHYWDRRARSYAAATAGTSDGFVDFLEPWLDPARTLIDVGAGTGRHAAPLADRLDWVTAVEPSLGMRALIPHRDNMTVVAAGWEDADVQPADLVICCHVLYGVLDPPGFIARLEQAARLRVFVQLRFGQMRTASDPLWELMTGEPRAPMPDFGDLYRVLLELAIPADVTVLRYPTHQRWSSEAEFVEEHRPPLGKAWDPEKAATWIGLNLERQPDGGVAYGRGESVSGVAHWQPR